MSGKRVQFDQETWNALDLLARDRMQDFQDRRDIRSPASPLRPHGERPHRRAEPRDEVAPPRTWSLVLIGGAYRDPGCLGTASPEPQGLADAFSWLGGSPLSPGDRRLAGEPAARASVFGPALDQRRSLAGAFFWLGRRISSPTYHAPALDLLVGRPLQWGRVVV